jgi:hypothetical protein
MPGFVGLVGRLAVGLGRTLAQHAHAERPAGPTLADALALHWEVGADHRGAGRRRFGDHLWRLESDARAREFEAAMLAAERAILRWRDALPASAG